MNVNIIPLEILLRQPVTTWSRKLNCIQLGIREVPKYAKQIFGGTDINA